MTLHALLHSLRFLYKSSNSFGQWMPFSNFVSHRQYDRRNLVLDGVEYQTTTFWRLMSIDIRTHPWWAVPSRPTFKYFSPTFFTNGQGPEEIRSRINLARFAFFCIWSQLEISLRTKGRVYRAVVRSILLYGCKTLPVWVANEMMLAVFEIDKYILRYKPGRPL